MGMAWPSEVECLEIVLVWVFEFVMVFVGIGFACVFGFDGWVLVLFGSVGGFE